MNARLTTYSVRGAELEALEQQQLKEVYVAGLAGVASIAQTFYNLRMVVRVLVARGINRPTLVRWGIEAGFAESYVRSLVSKLLCMGGKRERRSGAGPQAPPEALSLFALVCERYGPDRATRLLRAALHVAVKNDTMSDRSRATMPQTMSEASSSLS